MGLLKKVTKSITKDVKKIANIGEKVLNTTSMGMYGKTKSFASSAINNITGKYQQQANEVAQQQVDLQQQALEGAQASANEAELEAELQARRSADSRKKSVSGGSTAIGKSIGRLVR